MKTRCQITYLMIPVFILGLAVMTPAQSENPDMDILAPLKATLEASGAPDLNTDQENSILTLIDEFRNTLQILRASEAEKTAREEYENAILNLNSDAAVSHAAVIANARADEIALHEEVAAVFAIATIKIMKQNSEQYEALIDQAGQNGLVKLILGLFQGPRRGGPERGPGTPPPPETPLVS